MCVCLCGNFFKKKNVVIILYVACDLILLRKKERERKKKVKTKTYIIVIIIIVYLKQDQRFNLFYFSITFK